MCEPPRKWMRLTSSMSSGVHVLDVALHDPLEAVADADDLDAFEPAADGRGADDAVDAGGGAAADENCEPLGHEYNRSATSRSVVASGFSRSESSRRPALAGLWQNGRPRGLLAALGVHARCGSSQPPERLPSAGRRASRSATSCGSRRSSAPVVSRGSSTSRS